MRIRTIARHDSAAPAQSGPIAILLCAAILRLFLTAPALFAQAPGSRGIAIERQQFNAFQEEPRVAVIVAVDQYPEESGFRKLDFATKDADSLAQVLAGPNFNYKVQKLLNSRALRNVVRQSLKTSAALVNGKGTLVFFFAGHGGQKDGKQFLATYETGAEKLDEFGLPLSEVRAMLASSNAPRQIMIVDACRNDPTAAGGRGAEKLVGRFDRLEESKGVRILNATGPAQVSYEDPKLGHGIFSYFLLKGLQGEAADSTGLVTFRGLADYVSRQVRDFSFSANHEQMPYEAGDAFGDFLMGGKPGNLAVVTRSNANPSPANPPPPSPARHAADTEAWEAIRSSTDPQLFELFLREYPSSQFAGAARLKVATLRPSPKVAATLPPANEVVPLQPEAPPAARAVKVNPKDGLRYISIPPGSFMMGCSPGDTECQDVEKPAHPVTLTQGFWIGQTPVTQAAFQRVMGSNPSYFRGPDLPVEQVTWDQARNYCQLIGGRLPTEAQYEYAARAGSSRSRYGDLNAISWWGENSGQTTHPVGQKLPNAWGLYDMIGNVCHWTADFWGPFYNASQVDPNGPPGGGGRVGRGGSWLHAKTVWFRVSSRYGQGTAGGFRFNNLGFRCVTALP